MLFSWFYFSLVPNHWWQNWVIQDWTAPLSDAKPLLITFFYMFVSQCLIQLKHALLILCSAVFLIRILSDTKSKGTQKLKCIIPTSLPLAAQLKISSKTRSRFVWQGLFCRELCWLALIIFLSFNNLLIESLFSFPIISLGNDVGLSSLGVEISPACS